ncbi:MAG: LacI family transcriptional regulator [Anaerolineae bacterium]|nr:LacI family transcriptional regulator [Anaerolineae bacterium]
MVTMKEVADRAGVSIATVSRVINQNGYVSPKLEASVKAAMDALNYQPSALARGLRRQETLTVGVLVPQINHMFFGTLTFAIEKTLFDAGYRALICSAEENHDKEDAYIETLIRQRVDGVILVPTGHSPANVERLLNQNAATVLVDRDLPDTTNVSRVLSDNILGGYLGARHLLDLGHRRIGVISTSNSSDPMIHRLEGVKRAFEECSLEYDPDTFVAGTLHQYSAGYDATRDLLNRRQPPTAIFAFTDVVALGVLRAAAEMGLKVPDDLSIIGYDNLELTAYSSPQLTTIAQPIYEMGETAAHCLVTQMQNPEAPVERVMLPVQLVIRETTAAP